MKTLTKKAIEFTDAQLVKMLKNKDNKQLSNFAMAKLMNKYKQQLIFMFTKFSGNKAIAEDIVSETFIKVYEKIDSYIEMYAFSTWIYKIAKNTFIDLERKMRDDITNTFSIDVNFDNDSNENEHNLKIQIEDKFEQPDEKMERNERAFIVNKSLSELSNKNEIEILKLRFVSELSYEEIAEFVGLPLNTVKTFIFRGKESMRKKLIENNILATM